VLPSVRGRWDAGGPRLRPVRI